MSDINRAETDLRRVAALVAAAALAACATVPVEQGLPRIRYAQAASKGGAYALATRRPDTADLRRSEALWRRGLGEALACGEPRLEVIRIALAGAVELATMSAVATDGPGKIDEALLKRYGKDLLGQMLSPPPRPPAARCRAVGRWSDEVRADGQEAIGRAISKGLLPLL